MTYKFTAEVLDRLVAASIYSYPFVLSLVKHVVLENLPTDPAKLVLRAVVTVSDRAGAVSPMLVEQELHLAQAPPNDISEALDYFNLCTDVYGPPTEKECDELAALVGPLIRREVERKVIEDAVKLYGAGHSVAAMADKVTEAQNIGTVQKFRHVDIVAGQPLLVEDEHVDALETGIYELDCRLGGGLERQGLGLTLCETGGGKTMFLGHVAAEAALAGKNVYFASLEMTEKELKTRLYRNMLGMSKEELFANPSEAQRRYDLLCKRAASGIGMIRIGKFDPYTTSPSMIRQAVERLPFKADLVVVDYIGRMKSSRNRGANTELNARDLAIAMQELFNLARDIDGWCWTAQQINRDKTKTGPGVNQTAGSKEMATIASVILSMDMNAELREKKLAHFRVIKNRHGASDEQCIEAVTDLDMARVEATSRKDKW